MEYSSACCSAGWLWRWQSLGFELGIRGQAGWHCKGSTLGQVSSFQETRVTSCSLRFPWIVSLNPDGYWGHLLLTRSYTSITSEGGHQHPGAGWEAATSQQLRGDVLSSGWIAVRRPRCRLWMSVFSREDSAAVWLTWFIRYEGYFRLGDTI